jgi:uncharacterized RDD family membrane protein YckC
MEEKDLEYVGFWARVGATLIDSALILAITFPLLLAFYGTAYLDSEKSVEGPVDFILSYVFPLVAVILFWCYKQATPGKMAVRAKIVDAKTGGAPSVGKCIGRYFAYILSAIPLGLGYIWVAFDPKKQAWHDKLAGTVVVRPKKKDTEVKQE